MPTPSLNDVVPAGGLKPRWPRGAASLRGSTDALFEVSSHTADNGAESREVATLETALAWAESNKRDRVERGWRARNPASGTELPASEENVQSPETYIGYERAGRFVSPGGAAENRVKTYTDVRVHLRIMEFES